MSIRLAAIDPSLTSTAVATSWGVLTRLRCRYTGAARLDWFFETLSPIVAGAHLCVIEGYSMGSAQRGGVDRKGTVHTVIHSAELGGVIRLCLYRLRIPYIEIAPAKLKVFATGDGRSEKGAMLTGAVRRLGYAGDSDDESDALWLLEMARHHYRVRPTQLPRTHTRALVEGRNLIDWPQLEGFNG